MKQKPNRAAENPLKLASMTPQFHSRNGHKPSARDPQRVFKRIARGHISAENAKNARDIISEAKQRAAEIKEAALYRKYDEAAEIAEGIEDFAKQLFNELKELKKKT
jgi:hypothetical protein